MTFRLPSLKISVISLAGVAVAFMLFGWLILPRIIQTQAEKFISEKTGHHLTMNRPEFNPIQFSLHLSGLRLTQPDNQPLLAFRDLVVKLSVASLYSGSLIFDVIRLDGVEATVVMLPDGRLNWSNLVDALKGKKKSGEETSNEPLPKLDIHQFILAGARLDFADQRIAPAFATRIEPLDIELTEISTLPNEKGQYKVSAQTSLGASLVWQGEASMEPLAMTGRFRVEEVDFARLAPLIKAKLPIAPPTGKAGFSADYSLGFSAGRMDLNLEHIAAKITGLGVHGNGTMPDISVEAIEAKEGSFNLPKNEFVLGSLLVAGSKFDLPRSKMEPKRALELGNLTLENIRVNLTAHQAVLGKVAVKDGRVRITRDALGHLDLITALQNRSPANQTRQVNKVEAVSTPAEIGWHYRVEKFELTDFAAAFRDETVAPAAELAIKDIALSLEGISEDWTIPLPLRASFKAQGGGSFEAKGKITPAEPAADIRLKLTELSLIPAQPYLSTVTKLTLADGRLSTEGKVSYDKNGIGYQGNFALRNLRLTETESGNVFLAWKSLGSREFKATQNKLEIGELALAGLDTQLIINKDKTLSIKRIFRQPTTVAADKPAEPAVASTTTQPAHPYIVNIDRFRIVGSEMDFADYSLALPFGTRIHDLHGTVSGISSQPGAPGQLELDGQVDEYGVARAVGQIDFLNPTDFMDLKVVFRNVEMTRLTPYSATFAGRKIASGKLSLDLEYKIHQHQLQGENQVVMDQLVLGERVESPEAKNLPLDLALAILKDSDGRIELGLPVSGSLDDPQFSYGGIVWKAIVNVFTKIATAPFRALGALFGGGEKFENIVFEAGNPELTPPEREKLVRLAAALTKRPNLSVEIHGVYAEQDRTALQDRQLRRNVFEKSGQHVEGGSDPGPISLRQPKIQIALETLYSERFGSGELAALKEGFRLANPGQLEQSATAKVVSGLSGLARAKRTLNEQEVASLKGTDFSSVLFEHLRTREVVDDGQMLALATARGVVTAKALKADGTPTERIVLMAGEKVETEGIDVPLKLVLGTISTKVVPAASGVGTQ